MKIKSLEVDNHPVLGTFTYSFEDGHSINLLVGKNGSGKTRFIEFLHTLLDKSFRVWEIPDWNNGPISRIKLSVELEGDETKNLAQIEIEGKVVEQSLASGEVYFETENKDKDNPWNNFEVYMLNDDGQTYGVLPFEFKRSLENKKPFSKVLNNKTRYSGVQINFEYKPVTSYADIVDDDEKIQTKSNISLADDINKLLVATFNRDNTFLGEESRKGSAHPAFKGDFDRFRDAYNGLFQTKEILGVQQDGSDNKIILKDKVSGKEFGIDGLSSGEQQIVYRAGYLLRHLNIKNGGIVFIDEPELSLHPEWQVGYLQFLQNIFGTDIQFIIATHSPYIVKSGIDTDVVSITKLYSDGANLKNENLHHVSKLGRATFAEVNYKAFGIVSEELHTELYLALQRTFSPEKYDAARAKYIGGRPCDLDFEITQPPHNVPIFIKWLDINDKKYPNKEETKMTFIRNIINHGEDAVKRGRGRTYTQLELRQSIEEMLKLL